MVILKTEPFQEVMQPSPDLYVENIMTIDGLNLVYCSIRKNLNSQMLRLVVRYLYGHHYDISSNLSEHNQLWQWYTLYKNFSLVKSTDPSWWDNKSLKLAIIRDPIDRFFSAYLQFCYLYPQCHTATFNNCDKNPMCLLDLIENINVAGNWSQYGRHKPMAHFAPQHLQCYFRQHLNKYKLLRYENSDEFRNEIRQIIHIQGISENYTEKGWGKAGRWLADWTVHETFNQLGKIKRELLQNITLVRRIYLAYKRDYEFFSFAIPSVVLNMSSENTSLPTLRQ